MKKHKSTDVTLRTTEDNKDKDGKNKGKKAKEDLEGEPETRHKSKDKKKRKKSKSKKEKLDRTHNVDRVPIIKTRSKQESSQVINLNSTYQKPCLFPNSRNLNSLSGKY